VLDGLASLVIGVCFLTDDRDLQAPSPIGLPEPSMGAVAAWGKRLIVGGPLDRVDAGRMLDHFGLTVNPGRLVEDESEAVEVAAELAYPVVLKTASTDPRQRRDGGGVCAGLADVQQVAAAFQALRDDFGPRVVVTPMVQDAGVEMFLGAHHDEQLGLLVSLGLSEHAAETPDDVVRAVPPFDAATARRLLDGLRLRALLDGVHGRPAVNIDALCDAAAKFSAMVGALGEYLSKVEIDPILVREQDAIVLDALIIPRGV